MPATGDGISTVALSVITSTSGWSSADAVARLDVPGDDLGLGDAFADVRQLEDVTWLIVSRLHDALRSAVARPALGPGK